MLENLKLATKSRAGKLTQRISGPYALAVMAETEQGLFLVDPADFTIGRKLRHEGKYGVDELSRLGDLMTPESNVLVVGAHVGTLAIPLAKLARSVVAVEATPATFRLLELNLRLNEVNNCEALNIAASDSERPVAFLAGHANTGGNKRRPYKTSRRYTFDNPDLITVPAGRLDDVLALREFDLIVMDIEGSEVFALLGMPRLLSAAKALVVEFVPHHLRDVANVTVEEFLAPISPHFSSLEAPACGRQAEQHRFGDLLNELSAQDHSEDGLIFR